MWKKILIIAAGVVIVGLLVLGALFRTGVVLAKQVSQASNGNGILASIFDGNERQNNCDCNQEDRQQYQGPMEKRGRGNMENNPRKQNRQQPNGQNNWQDNRGDRLGAGQVQVDEWITLEGKVSAQDSYTMTVTTTDDASIQIAPRAWRFAQAEGFSATTGDEISLLGFYDEEIFEVGKISNLTSGENVELRDENGRPLWAGGGMRGRD